MMEGWRGAVIGLQVVEKASIVAWESQLLDKWDYGMGPGRCARREQCVMRQYDLVKSANQRFTK
jgi:hypothetical protein